MFIRIIVIIISSSSSFIIQLELSGKLTALVLVRKCARRHRYFLSELYIVTVYNTLM